ncbi:MAG: hypothetical protein O3B24_08150 [Verrucomicrobia bacterium]|nr:hypothetical protein [Verrucomicrobiota bacterium]
MKVAEFRESVRSAAVPPAGLSEPLQALWYAAKGHWDEAHTVAQGAESRDGSWIHAHLHREEGDQGNAEYWYARAGKPVSSDSVAAERDLLILHFLEVRKA